jgi:penicillin-binding protein 2
MNRFLGNAFSDSVVSQSKRTMRTGNALRRAWWQGAGRLLILNILLWIGFFVLIGRLFQLTVVEGHRLRALADDNRTRELVRHAPRGIIYDRVGQALVKNIPQYRILSPCKDRRQELCISRISEEEGQKLEAQGLPPYTFLEVEYKREYVYPEATAHVVGYTSEVNDRELTDEYFKLRKYQRGDHVGRSGAEAVLEETLRGRDGKELIEVDAGGNILRVLGRDPELSGEDVTLSIDSQLSEVVAENFPKSMKGAVVVSNPKTGEILALYSSPTFSLNDFVGGMSQEQYKTKIDVPTRPLFNRAIGGVYPPGSTYKIVTSLAGLETRVITPDTRIEDVGVIKIGPFSFPNWYFNKYGKTDGMVNLARALAHSNDIYFYKVGEMIGIENLRTWSKKVGVGTILGIELPGEASGLLPGPEWKNRYFTSSLDVENKHNEWYLGDTYHMSIGQGYLLTTPLQVNMWTNVIANDGYLCKPTIMSQKKEDKKKTSCIDLGIKQASIDAISEGMRQACDEDGTAYPLFNFSVGGEATGSGTGALKKIPLACKTGTAEFGHPQNKTHAWITVFAPIPESLLPSSKRGNDVISGDGEISVTVLVEEGGEGSEVAAPIAKKILEAWFTR